MNEAINRKMVILTSEKMEDYSSKVKSLSNSKTNKEYTIKEVKTNDEELKSFLFTLGCYKGETVTLLSILGENYVIHVKDARYSIDKDLADAIIV
jgi:Fe2+ transport system protein FeoA